MVNPEVVTWESSTDLCTFYRTATDWSVPPPPPPPLVPAGTALAPPLPPPTVPLSTADANCPCCYPPDKLLTEAATQLLQVNQNKQKSNKPVNSNKGANKENCTVSNNGALLTSATSAASIDSRIKDQLKVTSAQELIRTTTAATVTSKRQQLKLDIKTAAAVQQLLKKKGSTSSLVRLPDSPSARSVFPLKKRPLINSDLVIDDKSSILQPIKRVESSSQDLLQHAKGKSTY